MIALAVLAVLAGPPEQAEPPPDPPPPPADDRAIIEHLDELRQLELLEHLELLDPAGDDEQRPPEQRDRKPEQERGPPGRP